jgi:P27 family predicted phage terminase small subunit
MRTGRPPLPKRLHLLHGNPSRRKLDDIEEPVTRGPLGPPPGDLDPAARQVWIELEEVMPVGIVASCDAPLVASYCTAVARHREAVIRLRETGGSVVNRDGVLVMNPWSRIVDRQAVLIVKFGAELALTPTSRASMASRLAAAGGSMASPEGHRSDALARYLARKPDKLEPN